MRLMMCFKRSHLVWAYGWSMSPRRWMATTRNSLNSANACWRWTMMWTRTGKRATRWGKRSITP